MAGNREWMKAFARQAQVDLLAREALIAQGQAFGLPPCQELHFLQMACEKLSKAHLYSTSNPPDDVQSSHRHTSTQIPIIIREIHVREGGRRGDTWFPDEIRRLAREIALLHPQVDGGGTRPDNCEYPWEDVQGNVHTPADEAFPQLDLARSQGGRRFLKLLRMAIEEAVSRP